MSQIESIDMKALGNDCHDLDKARDQPVTVVASRAESDSDIARQAPRSSREPTEFIEEGETLLGHGYGGSESLTFFIRCPMRGHIVRKVLSAPLITAAWDRNGRDVMLAPHVKARRQAEWLQSLPTEVAPLFPRVLDLRGRSPARAELTEPPPDEFIYDMTFVPGIEISRFVREFRPAPSVVALLYAELFAMMARRIHRYRLTIPSGATLESSYFAKIEKRLRLSQATAPDTFSERLLDRDWIVINGRRLRNVPELLRVYRSNPSFQAILEPRFHSLVVGDTNTENIKIGNIEPLLTAGHDVDFDNPPFTAEDLEVRFLDPRAIGFHEDGEDTGADDPMYDNKPWHNSLGNYDMIHGEHFDIRCSDSDGLTKLDISFHDNNPYSKSYTGIGRYFLPAMARAWDLRNPKAPTWRNDPYWLIRFVFLMGTHFMAMPPFHFTRAEDGLVRDTPWDQKRPLAIYAEGVKWLNLAIDMLDGRVTEFYGVPVPDINRTVSYPVSMPPLLQHT
jgi:hypothetical protein